MFNICIAGYLKTAKILICLRKSWRDLIHSVGNLDSATIWNRSQSEGYFGRLDFHLEKMAKQPGFASEINTMQEPFPPTLSEMALGSEYKTCDVSRTPVSIPPVYSLLLSLIQEVRGVVPASK